MVVTYMRIRALCGEQVQVRTGCGEHLSGTLLSANTSSIWIVSRGQDRIVALCDLVELRPLTNV